MCQSSQTMQGHDLITPSEISLSLIVGGGRKSLLRVQSAYDAISPQFFSASAIFLIHHDAIVIFVFFVFFAFFRMSPITTIIMNSVFRIPYSVFRISALKHMAHKVWCHPQWTRLEITLFRSGHLTSWLDYFYVEPPLDSVLVSRFLSLIIRSFFSIAFNLSA